MTSRPVAENVHYDVIVLGVGAMGSAACHSLAKRGARVLGIEQFAVGHDRGSSHGETRIIRRAYFEHPDYVPLLNRAYELWDGLAAETATELFARCGMLLYGDPASSPLYRGARDAALRHRIPTEELSREEAIRRFAAYLPPAGIAALFEPDAGYLHAERAVLAHAAAARALGATILENEEVLGYEAPPEGVVVRTPNHDYRARKLVIAGGSWSGALMQELGLPLELHRMILYWFRTRPAFEARESSPCFGFHLENEFFYGFPSLDGKTVKCAAHFTKDLIDRPADKACTEPPPRKLAAIRDFVASCLPDATPGLDRFASCIYTMTPDEDFVIDRHPTRANVVFAAGFSGHGFKFASVIGEILGDLALEGQTRHPIDFLRLRDFKSPDS